MHDSGGRSRAGDGPRPRAARRSFGCLRLAVLGVDIGELDEMEAGVTCPLLRVTAQGQGGLLHPWDAGHLLAGGVLPALSRRTVRETFMACPITS